MRLCPLVCAGTGSGPGTSHSSPALGASTTTRGEGPLLPSPVPAPATFPTWLASGFVPASRAERFPQTPSARFFSSFQCLPLPVTRTANCILIK